MCLCLLHIDEDSRLREVKSLTKGHTAIAWPGRVLAWISEGTLCPWRPEKGHDLAGVGLWLAPPAALCEAARW